MEIMITADVTVGLAEWISDDACLFYLMPKYILLYTSI